MLRITPERVQEAYAKTGLRPVTSRFAGRGGPRRDILCGCPMTALVVAETGLSFADLAENTDPAATAGRALGLPRAYVSGFLMGFDAGHKGEVRRFSDDPIDMIQGMEDGLLVFKAIKPERFSDVRFQEEATGGTG